jgi:peptide/nickel transport system permease protein
MNGASTEAAEITASRPVSSSWRAPQKFPARIAVPAALLILLLACLLSPAVLPIPSPVGGDILDANLPMFSPGHLLGTDTTGNDTLSRLIHGGRTSLAMALAVNLIGILLGGCFGALGAYLGGAADVISARVLEVLLAFPSLILVLVVAQALGPGEIQTVCALSCFSVPAFARIARAATLRLREEHFILTAGFCGMGVWRTLLRHIAPNILPQLAAYALLGMAVVVNIEGAVSFLGLGVTLPQPSWGNMIYQGQMALLSSPRLLILPAAFLCSTVLAFNLLGEALRAPPEVR